MRSEHLTNAITKAVETIQQSIKLVQFELIGTKNVGERTKLAVENAIRDMGKDIQWIVTCDKRLAAIKKSHEFSLADSKEDPGYSELENSYASAEMTEEQNLIAEIGKRSQASEDSIGFVKIALGKRVAVA